MSQSRAKHLRRKIRQYLRNHPERYIEWSIESLKTFSFVRRLRVAMLIIMGRHAGLVERWFDTWVQLPRLAWRGGRMLGLDVARVAGAFCRWTWREVMLLGVKGDALFRVAWAAIMWNAVRASAGAGASRLGPSSELLCYAAAATVAFCVAAPLADAVRPYYERLKKRLKAVFKL